MINLKNTYCLFFTLIVIFTLFKNVEAQNSKQLSGEEFNTQINQALANNNESLVSSLIKENRLLVKGFIDNLLTKCMKLVVQGKKDSALPLQKTAEKIASIFENEYGETSLTTAVSYVPDWSSNQMQKKLMGDSLYAVGTKLRGKRDSRDEALDVYLQALAIYRDVGDQRGEGSTLGGLGVIYWYKRDSDKALSYYQQALEIRLKVDDRQLVGNSYNDIGFSVYWYYKKDYAQAIKYLLKSEEVRREIGDESNLGKTLSRIGRSYEDLGQLNKAFTYYNQAFEMFQKLNDENRIAAALYDCGIVLKNLAQYPEALNYYNRSLTIREKQGDKRRIGDALNAIGIVYKRLGDFESAFTTYQNVLKLMEESGNQSGMARAFTNMGVVLGNLNRAEQAIQYLQNSHDLFQQLEDQTGILQNLSNLGQVHFDLKNYTKSEEYSLQALQLSRELQDKIVEVNNLILLGNAQNLQRKFDQALSNYNEAMTIAQNLNSPEKLWPTLLGLADCYGRMGDNDKALEYYSQALDTIEGVRSTLQIDEYKTSYQANKRFAYEEVVDLLSSLHNKDKTKGYDQLAFNYAERSKARAFLDLLAESLNNVQEGVDADLLQKQEQLLGDLFQLQGQLQQELSKEEDNQVKEIKNKLADLEKNYSNLQNEIRIKNPKYSELQYPQPIKMEAVQSDLLDKNTILLQYSLGDSSSSCWVITKDNRFLYTLPNRPALEIEIEIIRFGLLNPQQSSPQVFAKASHKLYKLLVEPAVPLIKKGKNLLIVPDGVLHYLPFEVLLTKPAKKNAKYSDFSYLIKRNPISYGHSSSVLNSVKKEAIKSGNKAQKGLLAIGDPIYSENEQVPTSNTLTTVNPNTAMAKLSRLKYSGIEVQEIGKLFQEEQVQIYTRAEATEEMVKNSNELTQYKYIHFATHAITNERKPEFSAIVLAQDNDPTEDGYLRAAEIFNLKMNANLVVLSACQTGLGKMVRGEGMIGLTRAFMYAGTPSVIVSLWSVSDISTAILMEEFYKNLIKKRKNKTEALRRAQLAMIKNKKFSHPFYWAPFVLIGDWQ